LNIDKIKQQQHDRAWWRSDHFKQYYHNWALAHIEHLRQYMRDWRALHREHVKQVNSAWNKSHRAQINEYRRNRSEAQREQINKYHDKWLKDHPGKTREYYLRYKAKRKAAMQTQCNGNAMPSNDSNCNQMISEGDSND
jgi:hypothetical protein